ncbi:MAG: hypothetical protein A2653_02825 [Candidatus Zambryskibacteria bacterium RIFCSPHIGHO2_01_FULL_43_25]|uniref:DUF4446 domain-containing protein n=1 Tax=Candidatus Zambryskibacteria bacterium RIFCSPLOWO2_01_FULL_45_21 TaxID=1802761 RepID=A0A1G2U080_9BACT|nr:MAG: hypothetical protein A2653_02825 [Candidatus Zambryskibacteria bacterium RIFCSPHIGHO2_01_FULL_43_25]OHB02946.1 MAG: hypothetical protein A3B14_00670 [Candidatus Zambryskibacteria bacterium RIFCSPLOWO2_01_FULL_45_21]
MLPFSIPELNTEMVLFALMAIIILLVIWLIVLEIRLNRLLLGKDARSLENTITWVRDTLSEMLKFRDESVGYWRNVEARLKRSVQSIETVRFNPFKGTGDGGNQSFSTAFLNEKGDGVVISSLHSRDRVSVFSKPVKKFGSEFEMTQEEKGVIEQAKESVSIPQDK